MQKLLVFGLLFCVSFTLKAQLQEGSTAPDFTVQDINGNSYSLYAMMGSNKAACLDFSATWCGPCWSFHQSGVLESVYNNLSNETTVVFLESDWGTNTNCLYGPSGCVGGTQGNWVSGTPYPIADLSLNNGPGVNNDYAIAYYPTLYVISPDKRAWLIKTRTYNEYANWITKSFKMTASAVVTNSTCGDNGKVVTTVTNGFGTISYKWSNGATTKDLTNIPGGTYSVTISDLNGYYIEKGPYVVNGPSKRVDITNATLTHVKCFNEPTGNIAILVDYGTPPYTYNWSNGDRTDNPLSLKAGSYTVTVTDNAACTRVKTYTLTQPTDVTLSSVAGLETCDSGNGFISCKASGGVPPYLFDIGLGNQGSNYFADLEGDQYYTVTVTDNNGCFETSRSFVGVTHKPIVNAGPDKNYDCLNDVISLDGSQSSQGANLITLWTTRNGKIFSGQESVTPEISKPGTYLLKITDASNGCLDVDSTQVLDKRIYPNVVLDRDTSLNCVMKVYEAKGSSKDSQTKFSWKKVYDTLFYKEGSKILVSDTGNYIFIVKDTINLCVSKDTIEIKVDQEKPIAAAQAEKDVSCINTEVIIDASQSSQGGNFIYQWQSVTGNIKSGAQTLYPVVDKGGDYHLNVKNIKNLCESDATVLVYQQTEPIALFDQSIDGLKLQFNDQSNGLPTSWNWNFGDGTTSIIQNPQHVFAKEGEFEVCLTVTNDCGQNIKCAKLLIGISAPLSLASYEIQHVSCFEGTDGSIKINIQGGVPPYRYLWNNTMQTKDLFQLQAGNYSVEVTDAQGTKITKGFLIKEPQAITLKDLTIIPSVAGLNTGSIELKLEGGVPQYTYKWSNGQDTNPLQNLAVGEYSCSVTDANQCVKTFGPFEIKEVTANIENQLIKLFKIEPNPVSEVFAIHVSLTQSTPYQLRMINSYGTQVWLNRQNNSKAIFELDANQFASGIYFITLSSEDIAQTIKLVIR
ncbi:MAG: T9SS type A sorting domain-containing protein [Saprospiraceae bacterium]|nr:T9SS type A sorting domain-containing protein [Saprospiraceae bacterium]MBK8295926.1 T9SS type A sorting domain-containing protein [Saprospiraceae bacterium]